MRLDRGAPVGARFTTRRRRAVGQQVVDDVQANVAGADEADHRSLQRDRRALHHPGEHPVVPSAVGCPVSEMTLPL